MATRTEYNKCVGDGLRGKKMSSAERKNYFCMVSKVCSNKASSMEEAQRMCAESAREPKEPKQTRRSTRRSSPRATSGVRLVLLTTTNCPPCSAAKQYLQDKIDKGLVEVLDVQKSDFAADLVSKYKIISVPSLMVIDDEGVPFSQLQITENEQLI